MSVDISSAVHLLISQQPPLSSLLGTNVYTDQLPQTSTGPALVLWTVTETAFNTLGGALGMDQARIQFDAYAVSRPAANHIAWEVWTALDAFQGVVDGVQIKETSRATGVRSVTDRVLAGSDQYRFIATQDILFTYCSKQPAGSVGILTDGVWDDAGNWDDTGHWNDGP